MPQPRLLLLILITIAASGCRPAADATPPAPAAAAVEATWSDQLAAVRAGRSRQVSVTQSPVTPSQFAELADGCAALEVLDLAALADVAPDLTVVAQLPNLHRIRLDAPVDDAGLEQLSRAAELKSINLPSGTFTNRGLAQLAKLPNLELLRFRSPNVTDDALPHIAAMPSLRFLHLIEVPVTDAGIAHLHSMTQLESLYLDGGRCTDAGLRALLSALPDLHFHRDQLHLPNDPRADDHSNSATPPPR